jgi:DNA-binding transcriptional regulator YiaG
MPNIGEVLKGEIARLSKKAVRTQVRPVQAAASAQRKQLAALKKQMQALQRELATLKRGGGTAKPEPESEEGTKFRFTANGLKSLRARLGLNAEDFGRLVDVGGQTIYNWEHKKTTPRRSQLPAIASLRKMGKKEARAKLQALAETPAP